MAKGEGPSGSAAPVPRSQGVLPKLLTGDEVIRFLRIADEPTPAAREMLRTMRRLRRLPYVKLGRRILHPEAKLLACIERNTVNSMASSAEGAMTRAK